MAPMHSKLCSANPSPYIFSASRRREKARPTLLELVAPSPPRRKRGVQPTVTRVFNKHALKGKQPLIRRGSLRTHDGSASGRRATTPGPDDRSVSTRFDIPASRSEKPIDVDDSSSLSSLSPSPSPPPTPTPITRTRSSVSSGPLPSILRNKASTAPLTRSASRTYAKSGSRAGRKNIMAEIERRLEETGGIVTRYGVQEGEPVFVKDIRVTSTTEPEVVTSFWESFTLKPLSQPPDLTSYPDLVAGDIYCNIVKVEPPTTQLWIWTEDGHGKGSWKRAREGYQREDGRQLTVTPQRQQPSWVSPAWGRKQLRNPKSR